MWLGGISTERGADFDGSICWMMGGCLLGRIPSGLLGSAGDRQGKVGDDDMEDGTEDPCLMAGDSDGSEGVVMLLWLSVSLSSWGDSWGREGVGVAPDRDTGVDCLDLSDRREGEGMVLASRLICFS